MIPPKKNKQKKTTTTHFRHSYVKRNNVGTVMSKKHYRHWVQRNTFGTIRSKGTLSALLGQKKKKKPTKKPTTVGTFRVQGNTIGTKKGTRNTSRKTLPAHVGQKKHKWQN